MEKRESLGTLLKVNSKWIIDLNTNAKLQHLLKTHRGTSSCSGIGQRVLKCDTNKRKEKLDFKKI
jgi:hypothetical protein